MRRQLSLITVLALLFGLIISTAARADTTLGSTAQPSGSTLGTCAGSAIAQVSSDPSTPYTVPSSGTIAAWQVNTFAATPGAPVTLVVLRPVGGPSYSVVGADTHAVPNPLPGIASFTVPSPIAVTSGELLALYSPGTGVVCFFHHGSTPAADALFATAAIGAPAAGQTLVANETSGAGFTLNLAATLKPPAHKKKCKKKKKKKHSAESAKKNKCKKKKKKG